MQYWIYLAINAKIKYFCDVNRKSHFRLLLQTCFCLRLYFPPAVNFLFRYFETFIQTWLWMHSSASCCFIYSQSPNTTNVLSFQLCLCGRTNSSTPSATWHPTLSTLFFCWLIMFPHTSSMWELPSVSFFGCHPNLKDESHWIIPVWKPLNYVKVWFWMFFSLCFLVFCLLYEQSLN